MDTFKGIFSHHREAFIKLRQEQHRQPELSGNEHATGHRLLAALKPFLPETVLTGIAGTGIALIYPGQEAGPTVMIRAELDAVPVAEENQVPYRSQHSGISHACGHDGHMVMVTALAPWLSANPPKRGRVVLLFQPAEETGNGGKTVIDDPQWPTIKPDYAFALHNVPGLALGELAIRSGTFNCASSGLAIHLKGSSSHAAHPEDGTSPAMAMCTLIDGLSQLSRPDDKVLSLVTVIHARLGEVAFGTAPGNAVVMATLRAASQEAMDQLCQRADDLAAATANAHKLTYHLEWYDPFPLSANHPEAVSVVQSSAQELGLTCHQLHHPFRWSEDFGWISAQCKGAMFALGSGLGQAQLHSPLFDFPDKLLPYGASVFAGCIDRILNDVV